MFQDIISIQENRESNSNSIRVAIAQLEAGDLSIEDFRSIRLEYLVTEKRLHGTVTALYNQAYQDNCFKGTER